MGSPCIESNLYTLIAPLLFPIIIGKQFPIPNLVHSPPPLRFSRHALPSSPLAGLMHFQFSNWQNLVLKHAWCGRALTAAASRTSAAHVTLPQVHAGRMEAARGQRVRNFHGAALHKEFVVIQGARAPHTSWLVAVPHGQKRCVVEGVCYWCGKAVSLAHARSFRMVARP